MIEKKKAEGFCGFAVWDRGTVERWKSGTVERWNSGIVEL
jgi:hypothetical protein